jgi:hypothetical protein
VSASNNPGPNRLDRMFVYDPNPTALVAEKMMGGVDVNVSKVAPTQRRDSSGA